jgi:hypothetical protein
MDTACKKAIMQAHPGPPESKGRSKFALRPPEEN